MDKKILIIGSCGFIGKHLCKYFKTLGYKVFCADIIIKEEKDYFILNSENTNFVHLFMANTYEICINASGAANVNLSFNYPQLDFNLNTSNVLHILVAIQTHNPDCKFVNFSSAAVYGDPNLLPIREHSKLSPISPYGYHKMYSEFICKEFYDLYNVKTISLRVFSVYGEGLKKQIFWDLHDKIINSDNNEILILGNGSESRDFIYINDLLEALKLIIFNLKFEGQQVNIANGEEIFIKDAVEKFIGLHNKKINVKYDNKGLSGNPKNWIADISVIKNIGYEKKFDLNNGLTNYINWLNEEA
jgi:dTDP-glucose 4,6-dehydratase/UDP-glucose 4-epimerase